MNLLRLASWLLLAGPLGAQEPGAVWRVATKDSPPFAFVDARGEWRGIGIELAQELARRLEVGLELQPVDTVEALLRALEEGRADAALAAISVTSQREARVDFSHSYFVTGLGVAVRHDSGAGGLGRLLRGAASPAFLQLLGLVVVLLVGSGVLFWFFERRRHPQFKDASTRSGIGTGVWWSTIIFFGHKGVFPTSLVGSLFAAAGMLASILLLSVLTGAIASILTVSRLETPVRSVDDLRALRVVTVPDTNPATFLDENRVFYRPVASPRAGLEDVDAGEADAVVYDAPLLEYFVTRDFPRLHVLDPRFDVQDYAIAFPLGSAWRKPVNQHLLEIRTSEEWSQVLFRYLGR